MYIVQCQVPNSEYWQASTNVRGTFSTFDEAERYIIGHGMTAVDYRILHVMSVVRYVLPVDGGWKLEKP